MKPVEIETIVMNGYRHEQAGRIVAISLDGKTYIKNISGQIISGYSIHIKYPIEILLNHSNGNVSSDHKYTTIKSSDHDIKLYPDEVTIFELQNLKIDRDSIDRSVQERINIEIYTETGHLTKSYPVSELRIRLPDRTNEVTIQELFS